MTLKIRAFARIAEVTGRVFSADAKDTEALKAELALRFPDLSHQPFSIAVNRQLVHETVALSSGDEIALMPPYSGG